jgi:hypothetical protein
MKMEQTEGSETSAYKIQTTGNYPEENIQHSQHGESLKSRRLLASSYLSVSQSSMEQLGFQWIDFHEIVYLGTSRSSVEKIQVSLKSG